MQLNVLGIDFGTKRIGLAKSSTALAEPLKVIENNEKAIDNIVSLCKELNIDLIVIGISEGRMAELTEQFAQELDKKMPDLPIVFYDETLSSDSVHKKLLEAKAKKSKKQGPIDHYAAAEILQAWLDEQITVPDCATCPHAGSCGIK